MRLDALPQSYMPPAEIAELRVVFLIFSNGKIVCLGAKSTEEAHEAFKKLEGWLKQFIQ